MTCTTTCHHPAVFHNSPIYSILHYTVHSSLLIFLDMIQPESALELSQRLYSNDKYKHYDRTLFPNGFANTHAHLTRVGIEPTRVIAVVSMNQRRG